MELSRYYTTTRPDVLKIVPQGITRVLEIGCSSGRFSAQLDADEKWGVEPFAPAAAEATTCLDKVLIGPYERVENEIPDHHFDLVVANDVIEHMPDHDWFLEAIKKKMAPGAWLIGSLPNIMHITALAKLLVMKDWPYREQGILDRTHLRFFTRKSIERSLREHGYTTDVIEGNNSVLRDGVVGASKSTSIAVRGLTAATIGITFGYYWDTQFPQFAFRARLT